MDSDRRFLTMYVAKRGDDRQVCRVFTSGTEFSIEDEVVVNDRVSSIVNNFPAAAWDERELRDLHGIEFDGHVPHRALVDHTAPLKTWTTPVRGNDVYDIAVGPIHAGVIESGHFRFHVIGERVLHLDLQMFYNHRGIEQLVIGKDVHDALEIVGRACAGCHVANSVVVAQACELALGVRVTTSVAHARTVLLELERVWNHCNDISAMCAGVGYAMGTATFAAFKERAQRTCERLTGHRFMFGTVQIGQSRLELNRATCELIVADLSTLKLDIARAWKQVQSVRSVEDRCRNFGVLEHDLAERLGAVGPVARASGVDRDVRTQSDLLVYPNFEPATLSEPVGDIAARMEIRAVELDASLTMLCELLTVDLVPDASDYAEVERGIAQVESARGATSCVVVLENERVVSLRLRTSSFANWPVLAAVVPGNLVPDFPIINKSFELCYACCDR